MSGERSATSSPCPNQKPRLHCRDGAFLWVKFELHPAQDKQELMFQGVFVRGLFKIVLKENNSARAGRMARMARQKRKLKSIASSRPNPRTDGPKNQKGRCRDSSGACPLGGGAIGSDAEQVVFEGAEFIAQARCDIF